LEAKKKAYTSPKLPVNMFLDNLIIFRSSEWRRRALLLGSESVEVLGQFCGFVPYHSTNGPFEASHACFPYAAG
jgi:hypothetical protein